MIEGNRSTPLCAILAVFFVLLLTSAALALSTNQVVEGLLAELDLAAEQEQGLIAAFKANIAEKTATEAAAETLQADTARYSTDVTALTTFCTGSFSEAEFARRKAICDTKQTELDTRRSDLSHLQEAIDARRTKQQQEAASLAASSAILRQRAAALEDSLAGVASFTPISIACREVRGIGKTRDCLRAGWKKASTQGISSNMAKFCAAKLKLAADERAIQQMNFANDTDSFEMFAAVSKTQKELLQQKMVDLLLDQAIDQGLDATTKVADSAKSLNPFNVNTTISKLRAQGLNSDAIFAGLRKIAATKDKPAMAAAYKELVDLVKDAKEGYDTNKAMSEDAENANLRLLLGVLKVAQGNPELGLVVTGADFGESLAYLGYISAKVDDLNQATDNKLLRLNSLIARLKQDVRELNAARDDLMATNEKPGEPDCRP